MYWYNLFKKIVGSLCTVVVWREAVRDRDGDENNQQRLHLKWVRHNDSQRLLLGHLMAHCNGGHMLMSMPFINSCWMIPAIGNSFKYYNYNHNIQLLCWWWIAKYFAYVNCLSIWDTVTFLAIQLVLLPCVLAMLQNLRRHSTLWFVCEHVCCYNQSSDDWRASLKIIITTLYACLYLFET